MEQVVLQVEHEGKIIFP